MTPAARIAAAIEVLDRVREGAPAEQALTTWARGNRFAGSKDRAAIRDHVFDALRCRSSFAMRGGGETGRALMIGLLRAEGRDPAEIFTGDGYAPPPLVDSEASHAPPPEADWPDPVRLDYPGWLDSELRRSLGRDFEPTLSALRSRAPLFLRVNIAKGSRDDAMSRLESEGIAVAKHPVAETALEVIGNPRAVARSEAYLSGFVEVQDASSQAAVALCGRGDGARALDYCAGGGGKALALAALGWQVTAHDAAPRRMVDLPARATRAGAVISITDDATSEAPFDLVFVDAPCSGSGAWRRQAEARWTLTPGRLSALCDLQGNILEAAAPLVRPGGRLVYATCSLLMCENEDRVDAFLSGRGGWEMGPSRRFSPIDGPDGFFLSMIERRP